MNDGEMPFGSDMVSGDAGPDLGDAGGDGINIDAPRAGADLSDTDYQALSPEGQKLLKDLRSSNKQNKRANASLAQEMREIKALLTGRAQGQPQEQAKADPNDITTYSDEQLTGFLKQSRATTAAYYANPKDPTAAAEFAKIGDWDDKARIELGARAALARSKGEIDTLRGQQSAKNATALLMTKLNEKLGAPVMATILNKNGKFDMDNPLVERAQEKFNEEMEAQGIDLSNDAAARVLLVQAFAEAQAELSPKPSPRGGFPATSAANGQASSRAGAGSGSIAALMRRGDARSMAQANEEAAFDFAFGSGKTHPAFEVPNAPRPR